MKEIKTTDIKPFLQKMVKEGRYEANFGKLINAQYFAKLLESKNIQARIDKILGNARTVDVDPKVKLLHHFHVQGMTSATHNVLKKFM